MDRLVEAVIRAYLLDGVFRQGRASPRARQSALRCRHLDLHDASFDRAARHKLHDDEDGDGDPDERRDDQEESPEEVRGHLLPANPSLSSAGCFLAYSSQTLSSTAPTGSFALLSAIAFLIAASFSGSIHQRPGASR